LDGIVAAAPVWLLATRRRRRRGARNRPGSGAGTCRRRPTRCAAIGSHGWRWYT